jgi:tripartite-type tricarboxylate transporter receptor subunit TctC
MSRLFNLPTRRQALAVLASTLMLGGAQAQGAYPNQPIRMVVPFAPGGGNDVFARVVAPALSELLGQSVVVENRPGASGSVGAGALRSAPADGYTILLSEVSIHAVNAHLQKGLPYDAVRDLKPVTIAGTYDYVLVVNPKLTKARTLAELRTELEATPNGGNYGVPGIGTPHHLGMELLASKTGLKLTPIAYRGAAPAVQDLLSGQIGLMLSDRAAVRTHIKAGSLHAIAVAGANRVKEFPEVPTIAESGVKDFAMESWFGLSFRTGTPDAIVNKWAEAYAKVAQRPDVIARLSEAGINLKSSTPESFASFIAEETRRWGQLIQERGITAN